ncbi:carcinoembryonic antigen-related cell adhesion molecule 21-like isoform X6 [Mustela lutreola]|uniref:carcinoembryonic antigen-related cell adhesion molecule 21-like isoform X6 n=1 Tax=Mustela lutreola TaxID=9666 RepID=UPI002797C62D|nr:carcinoembryonic antigen-related cell adhesion molecule 21-like isoform X6 [Mustela lutreola]
MKPTSAPPQGGRVPWQDLLLAVSLLTLWNPPTTAQVTVESVPPSATEGKDVLLQVHNLPRDTGRFNWYKGATTEENLRIVSYILDTQKTVKGPAHSGRETVYPNGSLLFQNITLNDTGVYTLQIINRTYETVQVTGQLHVSEPLAQPSLHASNTTLTEDDSVFLTCSTNNTGVSIRWLFDGQSLKLTERMTLSQDNSTLTIHPVRKEDAGNYQCEVSNPGDSSKSDPVRLVVKGALTQLNPGLAPGVIAGIVIGVLAGVAVIVTLVYFLFIRKTGGANDLRDVTEHKPSASNHSQDHSDNLSKSEEVAYSSLNFSAHEPKKTTSASPSPADTETKSQHAEQKGRTGEGEATYFPTSLLLDTVSLWLLRKGFHSILLDIMLCLRGPSKRASWEFCALRYLFQGFSNSDTVCIYFPSSMLFCVI